MNDMALPGKGVAAWPGVGTAIKVAPAQAVPLVLLPLTETPFWYSAAVFMMGCKIPLEELMATETGMSMWTVVETGMLKGPKVTWLGPVTGGAGETGSTGGMVMSVVTGPTSTMPAGRLSTTVRLL